jgi:type I restriction enzyme, S subunit
MVPLRRWADCLDGSRIPLNASERAGRQGEIPYWGASGILDYLATSLFNETLVLLGEDGAPFFDKSKPVAFLVYGPIWPNNHIHVLRPRSNCDARFLTYALNAYDYTAVISGSTRDKLTQTDMSGMLLPSPPLETQRSIADFLDREIALFDGLLDRKRRLVALAQERIDAEVMEFIGLSDLAGADGGTSSVPLRRLLAKLDREAGSETSMVTAFRDGQVTARSLRRPDGFTEAWTDGARVQGVEIGDVVVHGLDGFAGAIGTSEASGSCSPVYHVCSPVDGGDAHFYGRFLRLLATENYLSLFAVSTRERAVDFRNWDLFGRIPIPVVNVADQHRIGDRIRALSPLRVAVELSAALVAERKQALITAAVTGQLDLAVEIAEEAS